MTRARVAVACLVAGLLAVPAGAYLAWGPGPALLLAGTMLLGVAVLLGWGA